MAKRVIALVALLVMAAFTLVQAAPVTYYVDAVGGNDANSGTSTSAAWRTLARAASQAYGPGDQILLKRGCVWQEAAFMPTSSGAPGAPIVMADYGSGNLPKIVGNADCAIILRNVQYWTLRNLDLAQVGLAPLEIEVEHGKDKDQFSDTYAKAVLEIRSLNNGTTAHIRVENCKIHDGHWNGIYVSGGLYQLDSNNFGYVDDVVVTGCEAYNNQKSGMDATCTYTKEIIYTCTNIQVLNSVFHDNGADGVVLGPVGNGLIDHCEAYRCGLYRNARLGLWCWDSNNVVIQFSESHHNTAPFFTKMTRDGGGFDLDLGAIDCTVQYCYSHDNTGEGYLLMTWPIGYGYPRGVSYRQTMRYCISERDATENAGSIAVFGGADCWMYNNVLYYVPERSAGSDRFEGEGACLTSSKWGKSGTPVMRSFNNIFICDKTQSRNQNAVSYLVRHTAGTLTSDYNCYYRVEGGVQFLTGSAINTWAAWQAAGYDAHGMNQNPMVAAIGGGSAASYMLQAGSPCINAGRAVTESPRGMGSLDFFGNPNLVGGSHDIGVHEYQGGGGGDTQAPTAPTNLVATAVSSSRIDLSWTASTDNVGVTGYKIFRGGVEIDTVTGTTYSDTGLAANTTYSYYVKAFDAAGNISAASNTAQATTQSGGGDTQAPTAPTNLAANAVSSSQINLTWTASTDNVGVTGYQIFRDGEQVGTSATTSYSDTGLAANTTYSYYVKAYDAAGNVSAQSNTAQATTQGGGGTNLALNKPTTVSTLDSVNQSGAMAVDGNATTYWRTKKGNGGPSEWIVVDLGSSTSISSVVLKWNAYYATNYVIEVSTDNTNWTQVYSDTAGNGGTDTITFTARTARYVRMFSTAWNNVSERIRLNEIEIYQ
ncbi:MAG: discoidin domain-containing protein [Patescibacteria group bacterium]